VVSRKSYSELKSCQYQFSDEEDEEPITKKCKKSKVAAYKVDPDVSKLIKEDEENKKLWDDALGHVKEGAQVSCDVHLTVQHRSSIGLSQLLLAFAILEQVVGSVASSHSQLEQAVACFADL
jgi:hypothetical protein